MRFTFKYIALFVVTLSLSGCGATGHLLGKITMLPIKTVGAVTGAITYQDNVNDLQNPSDIDQHVLLNQITYD